MSEAPFKNYGTDEEPLYYLNEIRDKLGYRTGVDSGLRNKCRLFSEDEIIRNKKITINISCKNGTNSF